MYCFHNPFKLGKAPGKNSLKLLQKLLHSIQFWKKKKDMAWIINTAPDYMVEFNNMVIILYIHNRGYILYIHKSLSSKRVL